LSVPAIVELYRDAHLAGKAGPSLPAAGSQRRQRLEFIDLLRAMAIIIVVATHMRDPFPPGGPIKSEPFGLLFRHINLIFIFVSGFLFQYLLGRFSYGSYLRTKLRNVGLPYLVMSLPALAIYLAGLKEPAPHVSAAAEYGALGQLGVMLVTGSHLAPFWFIPMMAIFYFVAPVLARMDRVPVFYWSILPLLAVSMVVGRSAADDNPAQNFLFYLPVYLIGMVMSHFAGRLTKVPALGWLAMMLCIFLPFWGPAAGDPFHDNFLFVTKIAFCIGLTGMLALHVRKTPRWLRYVGDISFGIFFVHYYAIALVSLLVERQFFGGRLAGITLYLLSTAVVFGLSVLAVAVIRRLSGTHSRQIVGA
jgi:peptidoglycan/LPS O-acetylase OafA/YrhL